MAPLLSDVAAASSELARLLADAAPDMVSAMQAASHTASVYPHAHTHTHPHTHTHTHTQAHTHAGAHTHTHAPPPALSPDSEACVQAYTAASLLAALGLVLHVRDALLAAVSPLDDARVYWEARVPGRMWADIVEGGPVEAAEVGLEWWRARRSGRAFVYLDAGAKAARLDAVQHTMLTAGGALIRLLGACEATFEQHTLAHAVEDAIQIASRVLGLGEHGRTGSTRSAAALLHSSGNGNTNASGLGQSPQAQRVWLVVRGCGRVAELHSRVLTYVAPLRERSAARRYWWQWTALALGGAFGVWYVATHSDSLQTSVREAFASLREFTREHVLLPAKGMAEELFQSTVKPRESVADAAGLADARASLAAMLENYHRRVDRRLLGPELAKEDIIALAKKLDMRTTSAVYVTEIQHPLRNAITGDLVELMLIQVAFIKKELLAAMSAMDEILEDNRFNLQVMATIPALLCSYALGRLVHSLYHSATAPADITDARTQLRMMIRDLHRLLVLGSVSRDDRHAWRAKVEEEPPVTVAARLRALWAPDAPPVWETSPDVVVKDVVAVAAHAAHAQPPSTAGTAAPLVSLPVMPAPSPSSSGASLAAGPAGTAAGRADGPKSAPSTPPRDGATYKVARSRDRRERDKDHDSIRSEFDLDGATADEGAHEVPAKSSPLRDAMSLMELAVRPNPSYRRTGPVGSTVIRDGAGFSRIPSDRSDAASISSAADLRPHPSNDARPPNDPSPTGSSAGVTHVGLTRHTSVAFEGLQMHQVGRLWLLLRRLAQLLVTLQPIIPFAEWRRMTQDVDDLSSGTLSETQRLATCERMMIVYEFIHGAGARGLHR